MPDFICQSQYRSPYCSVSPRNLTNRVYLINYENGRLVWRNTLKGYTWAFGATGQRLPESLGRTTLEVMIYAKG
jgi:hypothetical protein